MTIIPLWCHILLVFSFFRFPFSRFLLPFRFIYSFCRFRFASCIVFAFLFASLLFLGADLSFALLSRCYIPPPRACEPANLRTNPPCVLSSFLFSCFLFFLVFFSENSFPSSCLFLVGTRAIIIEEHFSILVWTFSRNAGAFCRNSWNLKSPEKSWSVSIHDFVIPSKISRFLRQWVLRRAP